MRKTKLEVRFWAKVDKTGDCWEWTASKNEDGYGRIMVDVKATTAHRLSFILSSGEIPNNLCVCHECDNPACVRPSHLFLGTHADNMKDRSLKGRWVKPTKIPKTHCPKGHAYTPENTYLLKSGARYCRECQLIRTRSRRQKAI